MAINPVRTIEQVIINHRDSSLIKSTLSGDHKAFAKLTDYYKVRIYRLGLSFFKSEADADDFVQEVFIKVYLKLNTFKGESAFSTWIFRLAYNIAINSTSRRKEYLPIADEAVLEDGDYSPEESQIRRMTAEAVREAVAELPENNAVCIELYFFYDMSYEEIMVVTGFPLNTIKSHIFRAKKILKEKLRGLYE